MIETSLTIEGLQEAQDLNLRVIQAFEPGGIIGEAVKSMTIDAHRYLVSITHADTGAYRASHRVKLTEIRGEISIDPSAQNPKTGRLVSSYGFIEEARGGGHAAYGRTEREVGDRILESGIVIILRSLE